MISLDAFWVIPYVIHDGAGDNRALRRWVQSQTMRCTV